MFIDLKSGEPFPFDLKPCPFCGKKIVKIRVYDDEGNFHGELGCDYENNPWSGLSYGLFHPGNGDCLLCNEFTLDGIMGNILFDTPEEAVETWNRRMGDETGRS